MLKIRLQRIGKKGQAYFRFVVLEHTTRPKGKYLELLGSYDPHKNTMEARADRIKYWMSQGAQLSPTANNLLVGKKIIEGEKVQVWKAKTGSNNSSAEASADKQEVNTKEEVKPEPKPETQEESKPEAVQGENKESSAESSTEN